MVSVVRRRGASLGGLPVRARQGCGRLRARALGVGDPVYGHSDLDLAVVVPTGHAGRVRRRWRRLCRAFPLLANPVDLAVYEDTELAAAATATTLTAPAGGPPRLGEAA